MRKSRTRLALLLAPTILLLQACHTNGSGPRPADAADSTPAKQSVEAMLLRDEAYTKDALTPREVDALRSALRDDGFQEDWDKIAAALAIQSGSNADMKLILDYITRWDEPKMEPSEQRRFIAGKLRSVCLLGYFKSPKATRILEELSSGNVDSIFGDWCAKGKDVLRDAKECKNFLEMAQQYSYIGIARMEAEQARDRIISDLTDARSSADTLLIDGSEFLKLSVFGMLEALDTIDIISEYGLQKYNLMYYKNQELYGSLLTNDIPIEEVQALLEKKKASS